MILLVCAVREELGGLSGHPVGVGAVQAAVQEGRQGGEPKGRPGGASAPLSAHPQGTHNQGSYWPKDRGGLVATKFRGITWSKAKRKWIARIRFGGKRHYLGLCVPYMYTYMDIKRHYL